jgi:hypothetical protein
LRSAKAALYVAASAAKAPPKAIANSAKPVFTVRALSANVSSSVSVVAAGVILLRRNRLACLVAPDPYRGKSFLSRHDGDAAQPRRDLKEHGGLISRLHLQRRPLQARYQLRSVRQKRQGRKIASRRSFGLL